MSRTVRTGAQLENEQADRRRAAALERLNEALAEELEVPPPAAAEDVRQRYGAGRKLSPEAIELARQVYYLQYGSMRDAARAIIGQGLVDVDVVNRQTLSMITGRLDGWWLYARWPRRSRAAVLMVRDAMHDGGLFRGRPCKATATGNGPAPKDKKCGHTALEDSDFCWMHDPRPKYVQMRADVGRRFSDQRKRELVPSAPFFAWVDAEGARLAAAARERGESVHWRDSGLTRVARRLCIGLAALQTHRRSELMLARTVVRFLDRVGVEFRDVYGFEPPIRGWARCPSCGGRMGTGSKRCMRCHQGASTRCRYLAKTGRRCGRTTRHESGYCEHCRQVLRKAVARW